MDGCTSSLTHAFGSFFILFLSSFIRSNQIYSFNATLLSTMSTLQNIIFKGTGEWQQGPRDHWIERERTNETDSAASWGRFSTSIPPSHSCILFLCPSLDTFDDDGVGEQTLVKAGEKSNYVHIRIQQRNGRKSLTTVQGLTIDLDLKKILKALKKVRQPGRENRLVQPYTSSARPMIVIDSTPSHFRSTDSISFWFSCLVVLFSLSSRPIPPTVRF